MAQRNGAQRGAVKVDRPFSSSALRPSSSFKSRLPPPPSNVRRSCPSSLGGPDASVSGRVRVAVRLRPRNTEELAADADFADCVELQPELKRLKLRKNNWDSDTYEFDEVLTEFASQKRVYEVVAKPVVESVLDGYNGTVMAYGQTGTGKTFTLGRLGDEDTSARGIMVRAMEDILANVSPQTDSILVSYLQLYMEAIQDLLNPANDNISIVEDQKTGDVSLPGATVVEIHEQHSFMELLRLGEAHRVAANTKLNTESSRSHAILLVHIKRSMSGRESDFSSENDTPHLTLPILRKGKLVIVDLAGSERIHKSGSEGHMLEEAKSINLSLSALGKCINALAENSAHVPVRDSKLTRLLRDSFGGTARTSLIVTIGPSPRHRAETASTILFGQRVSVWSWAVGKCLAQCLGLCEVSGVWAMKVENMLKIKEEFDYKSLSRSLEIQVDKLIANNERRQKAFEDEVERITLQAQKRISEADRNYTEALERERMKCQMDYMESIKMLEEKWVTKQQKHGSNGFINGSHAGEVLKLQNYIFGFSTALPFFFFGSFVRIFKQGHLDYSSEEVLKLKDLLQNETCLRKAAEEEIANFNTRQQFSKSEAGGNADVFKLYKMLEDETHEKKKLEEEVVFLRSQLSQLTFEGGQVLCSHKAYSDEFLSDRCCYHCFALHSNARSCLDREGTRSVLTGTDSRLKDGGNGERASIANLHEQVGLHKILSLLESEDANVRMHAVKVVANLAAEEANQERIVEAGGLSSLLMLLRSFDDETICRVAAGAIANLAMNETNQELIMVQGGISLLAVTASDAEDPQTLRMIAGAIANLCGNDKLQMRLRSEGGIRALLGMVRCRHPDVLSQVARGIANFAKCESRASTQGTKIGRSLLIEDGALPWIVQNANNEASIIRRHIELALCHMAQHEVNVKDMISGGALWELVRISRDCSRDDIRALARRTLTLSPTFQAEMRRLRIEV
ncbi:hypothetical protein RJ639_031702 [Escallonia herrerae]|uniref:Kinesin-like protein n=1 Tax=Escallonia herrerae TaxID=1293975 RepID=A0AA89BLL6_9ASTE|nr:hypothetical protein RJ639_031702 [Escallonia herrerae]